MAYTAGSDFECKTNSGKLTCTALGGSTRQAFMDLQRAANTLAAAIASDAPPTKVTGVIDLDTVALVAWLWPILRDTRQFAADPALEAAVGQQLFGNVVLQNLIAINAQAITDYFQRGEFLARGQMGMTTAAPKAKSKKYGYVIAGGILLTMIGGLIAVRHYYQTRY